MGDGRVEGSNVRGKEGRGVRKGGGFEVTNEIKGGGEQAGDEVSEGIEERSKETREIVSGGFEGGNDWTTTKREFVDLGKDVKKTKMRREGSRRRRGGERRTVNKKEKTKFVGGEDGRETAKEASDVVGEIVKTEKGISKGENGVGGTISEVGKTKTMNNIRVEDRNSKAFISRENTKTGVSTEIKISTKGTRGASDIERGGRGGGGRGRGRGKGTGDSS